MLYFNRLFFPIVRELPAGVAYPGSYNPWLVVLSVLIAISAAFVALSISGRIAAASRRARMAWTGAGAMAMGGGIWSMHFIGMLAFSLPCGIGYDERLTVLSTVPGVLASGVALQLISQPHRIAAGNLFAGAVLMGAGIGAMHYAGMAAMQLQALLLYSPTLVAASVVVAIALAAASLSVRRICADSDLPAWSQNLLAATLMGCAVAGMHYTAMRAAVFFPEVSVSGPAPASDPTSLAVVIAVFASFIAAITLIGSFAGRQSELATNMAAEIERREKLERDAVEGRSRLQAIFDAVVDAIVTIDAEGRILQWSSGAQRIFGYAPEEVVGRNVTLLMPEPHRSVHHRYVGSYLATGHAKVIGAGRELTALRKDGGEFPMELAVGEARIGEEIFFTGIMRDITERKRAEQELIRARETAEAANVAKSSFLATMSHEIRTPLNGVLGMASLLSATSLTERQHHLVDSLTRSGQGLLGIINDILDLSKIEAGRLDLVDIDFDLREVVAEVADMFVERCSSKGLELVYYVAEEVPGRVVGDPSRLRQVLVNLVGNAFKFTERGEILIEVSAGTLAADYVMLTIAVEDTGIGIEPQKRAQVFESFQQADNSMTRSRGGTGLGLAISRELVGLMGGKIGVESEFGRGSRFQFTIRCGRFGEPEADTHPLRRIEHPMRLLLVDTNAISAHIMSLYLAKWMIDVELASTLAEAEAALGEHDRENGFDVVMLDLKGLGTPGIELGRQIRKRTAPPALILLTGLDGSLAEEDLETLGAFATLTKPVRPSVFFECLAALASCDRDHAIAPFFVRHDAKRHHFSGRILVAEDNPINQDVVTGILENMGCRVVTAPNGRHAVRLAAQEKFDLILMDCEMPEMDGFEATKRIRDLEKLTQALPEGAASSHLPIVALTAHALADIRDKCLRAGMDDFLVKPFDERQLAKALARWLDHTADAPEPAPEQAGPEVGAPASASVIDLGVIAGVRTFQGRKGRVLLQRVVSQFSATAPEIGSAIRAAFGAGDSTALWRAAHSLKSSAAALGALRLSRNCARIETLAREEGIAPVKDLLAELDAEITAAVAGLGELLETADAA
jgi:two-component system, sensor histidine kinase and response regulator